MSRYTNGCVSALPPAGCYDGEVMVETLFLDAGGVLTFPNWDRVADTLTRHGLTITGDALRQVDPPAKFSIDEARRVATSNDADRGSMYFDAVLDNAGVPRVPERDAALSELYAYHTEHNLWEYVPADVVPALERLSALGVTIAIASNANGALQRMFDRVGLTRYFHAICDSCVEGVEKPDPRFFRIVLERSGGRPETTLHVGDLYHVDVVGARSAGLQAMLIDPHDLYEGYDVERVRSLSDLADRLSSKTVG
jgi:HAD superfamily hydrolase (TIGR01549 family)